MSLLIALTLLLSVLILGINGSGNYSATASYSFPVWRKSDPYQLISVDLSADDDKFITISYNQSEYKFHQVVYNFNGSVLCEIYYPGTYRYIGWPSKTSGFIYDLGYERFLRATSACGDPYFFSYVSKSELEGVSFSHTANDSYVAMALAYNTIVEHNLGTNTSKTIYFDNQTQFVQYADYGPQHSYLYASVVTYDNKLKTVVFNASSGERKRQIYTDLPFFKGTTTGDNVLIIDQDTTTIYNIDKDGIKKKIWAPPADTTTLEIPLDICTDDVKLITIKITNIETNPRLYIVSYDTNNGSVDQSLQIYFVPDMEHIRCNDKYLSLVDYDGKVNIFKYTTEKPQPKPTPTPHPNKKKPLPTWAIVLIVVGSVLIVGGIIGFIIYKRKQKKSAAGEDYQRFNNQDEHISNQNNYPHNQYVNNQYPSYVNNIEENKSTLLSSQENIYRQ